MSLDTPTVRPKATVLVVDDDPIIAEFVELALEHEGYRVLVTVGSEALDLACTVRPDVILLDIMMPGMDGVEVCRRLRDDPATVDIPVIVMSAQDRLRTTARLMLVDDRLAKPFTLQDLFACVARWTKTS